MRNLTKNVLINSCICLAAHLTAGAADKPVEIKAGEAIPAGIIETSHLVVFKHDKPVVLPMVAVSFQTEVTEKAGGGMFKTALVYALDGIPAALMQKIADEAQDVVEAELKAGGWQILPAAKAVDTDAYKEWSKSPDPSREEVKRQFFSKGKGTNTFSAKEMERVFVAGGRPLVGNGVVLGGWTAAPAICKLGQAVGAKVMLVRVIVNFANITAGKRSLFTGDQDWKGRSMLEVSYAEMDVYPPDSSGATPARLSTEAPVTLHSEFIKAVQKSGSTRTVVADPERYEKDTVEAIRCVARGFVAQTGK